MKTITFEEFESDFESLIENLVSSQETIFITGHERGDFVMIPYAEYNEIQNKISLPKIAVKPPALAVGI